MDRLIQLLTDNWLFFSGFALIMIVIFVVTEISKKKDQSHKVQEEASDTKAA